MKRSTFITWEQLKVGSLILVALAVITIAVAKLGQSADLFAKRYNLVAYLPNASGLREGGQVTIAGVLAGTVKSIDFLPPDADTTRNLKVVVAVDRAYQSQIRADSKAHLRTMGLLGDKIFDITPGTPRYNVLREGDTVQVEPALDYEAVLAQAASAVSDMVELTHDMRKITTVLIRGEGTVGQLLNNRDLYDQLTGTLGRANHLIGRIESSNGTLARLLDDPTLYRNLTRMMVSVDSLVTQVSTSRGTLAKLMRDDSLYVRLVGITTGADSILRQVRSGNGFASKMLNDPTLYEQLLKSVSDLNAILADIRRDPSRYMKGMIKVF